MAEAPNRDERDDDTFGDEYPSDRPTAEETAVHPFDESLGGFDSEVDDPDLEAAYEIDPEVER